MRHDTSIGKDATTLSDSKMESAGQLHGQYLLITHILTQYYSHHSCRVHGFAKPFIPTPQQLADIILCRNDRLGDMSVFDMFVGTLMKSDTAYISGVRFTSGEPLQGRSRIGGENKRCGSVFTAVMDGVSRYPRTRACVSHSHLYSISLIWLVAGPCTQLAPLARVPVSRTRIYIPYH